MAEPLLALEGVKIAFGPEDAPMYAVRGVSLGIGPGEVVGLVGGSGSGTIMRLVPPPGRVSEGSVRFDGRDVLAMSARELRALRANDVGMIYQDPFSSLNPVFRIGDQLVETLRANRRLDKAAATAEAAALLGRVGIPDPQRRLLAYPHELSGGMRQRVMIALATASEPRLLIADEPTTALDVTTQAQILMLLLKMREELGMAVLMVSHDFGVIAEVCDRVAVMYGGHVVETGPVETIYDNPQHPYTRALLASVPELESAGRRQSRQGIGGQPPELGEELPGCVFAPRCPHAQPACQDMPMVLEPVAPRHASACPVQPFARAPVPAAGSRSARHERGAGPRRAPRARGRGHRQGVRAAPDDRGAVGARPRGRAPCGRRRVLHAAARRDLGLAGGSGSGKTTLARCLIRLVEPDAGTVMLCGQDMLAASGGQLRELRRRMQMVFQDPYASLNPRMSVGQALLEAGRVHRRPGSEDGDAFVARALERVQLSARFADRKPRELSGGQRQRVAVARALAVDPEVLIADEAVSALDVSVQAQLLKLFVDLRDELGVAILFVAHQLAVIAEVADRVAVMYEGRIVEIGETATVFGAPEHEYTKALLAAHPRANPRLRLEASAR